MTAEQKVYRWAEIWAERLVAWKENNLVARMESTPGAWKVDERVASMVFLLAEWSVEGWVLKQVILVASPMDE